MNTTKIYRFCELRKVARIRARILHGKPEADSFYLKNGALARLTFKIFPFMGFQEVYLGDELIDTWGYKA